MNAHEEEGEYGDRNTFLAVTSFLLVGFLTLWAGVKTLNGIYEFTVIDSGAYDVTKIIISGFVIFSAFNMFSRGLITEGLLVTITGISSISFSIGTLLLNVQGYVMLDLFLSIGIYLCAIAFLNRRNYLLFLASLLFAISISVCNFLPTENQAIFASVILSLSGVLFIYYSMGNLILGETGKNLLGVTQNKKNANVEHKDKPYELVSIAGVFFFSILAILVGYQFIAVNYISITYCVAEFSLSAAVIIFAMYALTKGMIPEGTMMLMFGISCFTFATVAMVGYVPSFVVDFFTSVVIGVASIAFLLRREWIMFAATFCFCVGGLAEALFSEYYIAGILIVATGIFLLYYSICRWLYLESGKAYLPIL